MSKNWANGKYVPINPEKYIGNIDNITYRSSWEQYFNQYVDTSEHVLYWASEGIPIKYYHPFYKEIRTYYPDYFVVYVDKHNVEHREIIEIKPENQITLPKKASKNQRITHVINLAKWSACKEFCANNNIEFRLCTEQQLFR